MIVKALSIRQPWAWLIVNGYKSLENRTWRSGYIGELYIHAGKTMSRADHEAAQIFVSGFSNLLLPEYGRLRGAECGGIVGRVYMYGCTDCSDSDWFCGPYGFLIREPAVSPFFQCNGKLGFFEVDLPDRFSVSSVQSVAKNPQPKAKNESVHQMG